MNLKAAAAEHGAARAVRKHCRNHSYDAIYSMPHNNIKIDQEFHNRLNRHRALGATTSSPVIENDHGGGGGGHHKIVAANTNQMNSANNKEYLDNRLINTKTEMPASTIISIGSHSRTNSRDLNRATAAAAAAGGGGNFLSSLVDDATNILRHRRTNSKDLNRILNPMPSTSETGPLTNESAMMASAAAAAAQTQSQYHKRNASLPSDDLREENAENDVAHVLLLGNSENHSDNLQMNRREND